MLVTAGLEMDAEKIRLKIKKRRKVGKERKRVSKVSGRGLCRLGLGLGLGILVQHPPSPSPHTPHPPHPTPTTHHSQPQTHHPTPTTPQDNSKLKQSVDALPLPNSPPPVGATSTAAKGGKGGSAGGAPVAKEGAKGRAIKSVKSTPGALPPERPEPTHTTKMAGTTPRAISNKGAGIGSLGSDGDGGASGAGVAGAGGAGSAPEYESAAESDAEGKPVPWYEEELGDAGALYIARVMDTQMFSNFCYTDTALRHPSVHRGKISDPRKKKRKAGPLPPTTATIVSGGLTELFEMMMTGKEPASITLPPAPKRGGSGKVASDEPIDGGGTLGDADNTILWCNGMCGGLMNTPLCTS